MAFNAAVEVSYLTEPEQKMLCEAIEREECTPNLNQARRLKQFSQDGKLDANVMDAIMTEEKPIEDKLVLKGDVLAKYFPKSYTPSQKQKVIVKLLEDWHMDAIMTEEKPIEDKLVLKGDVLAKYFPKSYTPSQKQKVIVKLLEDWHKRQSRQQER